MSSSAQMLVALVVGAAVGIFFGERVAWMAVIGNGVILLMQRTVFDEGGLLLLECEFDRNDSRDR